MFNVISMAIIGWSIYTAVRVYTASLSDVFIAHSSWSLQYYKFVSFAGVIFVVFMILVLAVSRYFGPKQALNTLIWVGMGVLLILFSVSSTYVNESLVYSHGEGLNTLRDFLLGCVIASVWFSALSRPASGEPGLQEVRGGLASIVRSNRANIAAAVGVAVAGACVAYAFAAFTLHHDSDARLLSLFGYGGEPAALGSWEYWLRLWAFCLENCAVVALGLYAYVRARRWGGEPSPVPAPGKGADASTASG